MTTVKKKLPRSWELTTLGLIAEIIMGQSPPGNSYNQEGEGTPLINGPVEFGPSAFSKTVRSKFTTAPKKFCKSDDLILCVRGSTTGRMNIAGFDASIGRGVAALRYPFCQNYLNTFIQAKREVIFRLGTGSTFPNVSSKVLDEIPIPLPPLKEQHRIVKKIESLTTHSRKAREALDAIPSLLDQFRQSVLAAAFRGDLTADWRKENSYKEKEYQTTDVQEYYRHSISAPSSWEKYSFEDICTLVGGSQPPKKHFVHEHKEGYVRLIQIRDYKSDKYITYIPKELARRFCQSDEIMVGRYGPPIFQILRGIDGAYNVALMKAKENSEKINREFLYFYLQTLDLFNYVAAASQRTAGQDGVRKSHLNKYPIFVPSLAEQSIIIQRISAIFDKTKLLADVFKRHEEDLGLLDQSILAKAFRGDLVPQDPTDEPAHILLERIRTEREKTQKAKKKTKRKKS